MQPTAPLVALARFGTPHGLLGFITLKSFTDPPEKLFDYPPPLLCASNAEAAKTPIRFTEFRLHRHLFVAKIAGFESSECVRALSHHTIYIEREQLPDLEQGHYWHDLIGMRVDFIGNDATKPCTYGTITNILLTGEHEVMRIQPAPGLPFAVSTPELLIPFVQDVFVVRVEPSQGRVLVSWPPDYF